MWTGLFFVIGNIFFYLDYKLGALLSGKILQTVECTNIVDVDLDWECWL